MHCPIGEEFIGRGTVKWFNDKRALALFNQMTEARTSSASPDFVASRMRSAMARSSANTYRPSGFGRAFT
jgi:hypothetical protein